MSAAERLLAGRLRASLGPDVLIGREIVVHDEVASTNDAVFALAQAGAGEGVVVFAETQTAGRGQRGNVWESARGKGLSFSFLIEPKIEVRDSPQLTSWAARVISETIAQELALESRVKPPNDVYLGERKVAGVLVEMRARAGAPHLAIVGIGINVNQSSADFSPAISERATSLAIATGKKVPREDFAVALLRNFDASYGR